MKFLPAFEKLAMIPTAPFREHWVGNTLDRLLAEIPGLTFQLDRFGNRIVRLRKGNPTGVPVTFVAHLDHPGFIFDKDGNENGFGSKRLKALFEGHVRDEFFQDAPVRVFRRADDGGVAGRVTEFTAMRKETDNRAVELTFADKVEGPILGMWDVPLFEQSGDLIHARVCDDLAGCAAILSALTELAECDHVDVAAVFSRAEECGFCGVLCLLNERELHPLLPKETIFISVENSGEMPGAALGSGAIIRTGDRSSTFDGPISDAMWSCARSAGLSATRRLMDRGTCEATAFTRAGYRSGGVCIPLRNYHNMDLENQCIAPEAISLSDGENLRALIFELARKTSVDGADEPVITSKQFEMLLNKGMQGLL